MQRAVDRSRAGDGPGPGAIIRDAIGKSFREGAGLATLAGKGDLYVASDAGRIPGNGLLAVNGEFVRLF